MERFEQLDEKLTDFIERQHLFFVATAGAEGRINLSPKGMDSLRVLDPNTIIWLNLTGSGNETAAHVLENERMTLMFCSYEKQPLILRLYGNAKMISPHDKQWARVSAQLPAHRGARQIFKLNIDLVQTSCGYAIPYYDYQGERDTLVKWTDKKNDQELRQYQLEKNTHSMDGKPTGIDGS